MGDFRVEYTPGEAAGEHYATLCCGRRIVARIPIPQEWIDQAEAAQRDAEADEAAQIMSKMLGGDIYRKAALADAADGAMAVHLARLFTAQTA